MTSTTSYDNMSPAKMNLMFDQDDSPVVSGKTLCFDDDNIDEEFSPVPMMMNFDEDVDDEDVDFIHCSSPARSESADSGCFMSDSSMDSSNLLLSNEVDYPSTEEDIKDALDREEISEGDLIADFSAPYHLPTVQGKHKDLTAIAPETVASLLEGGSHQDMQLTIVDCRYPYEYEGGHIWGAKNLYTRDMVEEFFLQGNSPLTGVQGSQKHVVIFHCEFSSERGPKMLRHLREQDRALNAQAYPALHYPEVYILEGGYKAFWENCNEKDEQTTHLCQPQGYRLMLDEGFTGELKEFRRESKGSTRGKNKAVKRSGRSRSRIFM